MALEPSQPPQLSAAIVQVSSLARACRDRAWQRQLLELAASCSAYAKAPRPDEHARILAKARSLVTAAVQLGEDASASAASAVIAAMTASVSPESSTAPSSGQEPVGRRRPASQAVTDPLSMPAMGAPTQAMPSSRDRPVDDSDLQGSAHVPPSTTTYRAFVDTTGGKITEPLSAMVPPSDQPLVFVIESDPQSRRVLTAYFGAAGFRVVAFDDASTVIARIREERPALIVAELVLSAMPGEVLILGLRRSPATATIPILVVTAEPWRLGPEHEVEGVLTKPVNVTVVVEAARRLLSSAAGTDSLKVTRM